MSWFLLTKGCACALPLLQAWSSRQLCDAMAAASSCTSSTAVSVDFYLDDWDGYDHDHDQGC